MGSYIHLLKKIYCFKGLSEKDIIRIQSVCREKAFLPGDVIFPEGSMEDCCFVLLEGIAEIRHAYKQRDEEILARCISFQIYGETGLFDSRSRTDTLLAETAVRLLLIRKDDFEKISARSPDMMHSVIRAVSDRIREKSENLLSQLQSGTFFLEKIRSHLNKENSCIVRQAPELKQSFCYVSANI